MGLDFYYTPGSPPCSAVRMTAKAVGVELNPKLIALEKGEHLTPEYLAINPQHVVPTLVDDGFALSESRAIILYLVDKYGKADSLYPSDPKKRAVVNHRLFFDIGTLYQRFADYYYPPILTKVPPNPEIFKKLEEAVGILNIYLDGQEFAAGSGFTVADISLIATVSSLDAAQFNLSKYPNVLRWFEKVKAVTPGYDSNEANLIELKSFLGL